MNVKSLLSNPLYSDETCICPGDSVVEEEVMVSKVRAPSSLPVASFDTQADWKHGEGT
jgi:hypothetical protein